MSFRKFTSIEGFHNVVKESQAYPQYFPKEVRYNAKVKLHGTNAAIGFKDNVMFAQKRTGLVTIHDDNAGFANWILPKRDMFAGTVPDCIIYGEWVGKGVQAKVAMSCVPKCFCVFSVLIGDYHIIDPQSIGMFMKDLTGLSPVQLQERGIYILDWYYDQPFTVNFFDKGNLAAVVEHEELTIAEIDKKCPFAFHTFGVEGHGEGLVYYPILDSDYAEAPQRYASHLAGLAPHDDVFNRLVFKAKGSSHERGEPKERKSIQLSPEQLKTQNEFVQRFVTEERLHQIAEKYLNNDFQMKNLGTMMKEFCLDVQRESRHELEESGLEWHAVIKPVQGAVKNWFVLQNKRI